MVRNIRRSLVFPADIDQAETVRKQTMRKAFDANYTNCRQFRKFALISEIRVKVLSVLIRVHPWLKKLFVGFSGRWLFNG